MNFNQMASFNKSMSRVALVSVMVFVGFTGCGFRPNQFSQRSGEISPVPAETRRAPAVPAVEPSMNPAANPAEVAPVSQSPETETSSPALPPPTAPQAEPVTPPAGTSEAPKSNEKVTLPESSETTQSPAPAPPQGNQAQRPSKKGEAVEGDPCADQTRSDDRRETCLLVNQERVKAGLSPIQLDRNLSAVSVRYAAKMFAEGFFSHVSPKGETLRVRLKQGGVKYGVAGENIARGQRSAAEVVRDWMASPGHRRNIMNPKFHRMGLGRKGNFWAQNFAD